MTPSSLLARVFQQDSVNFLVTNRVPRRTLTRVVARISRIEHPVLTMAGLKVWQLFGGSLDLHEAKTTTFKSLHDCFVRELRDGMRPVDSRAEVIASPCDAEVGQAGRISGGRLLQAKGVAYTLSELLLDPERARTYEGGVYATLRLRSTMYHRFHAPCDATIDEVLYVPGDTWNVNPITLRRLPRVFCMNERVIVPMRILHSRESLALVPVAAILVGGMHLKWVDLTFNLDSPGPRRITCAATPRKGDELGHFLHGSTIIVLGTSGLRLDRSVATGSMIRTGEPLLRL
jgi:phosphatidylserine decarboxylase